MSLTVLVDDAQWADEASIRLLGSIIRQRYKKVFFLVCYRDDEVGSDHPFYKMLENVGSIGIISTSVKVANMGHDTLNTMISDLLCRSPRLVHSLSKAVFSKTKGNALFVSQLLLSLYRDGLLYLDLDRQRWVWDEEKISSLKLPLNAAAYFTSGISKLPIEVQLALHTVAMFGFHARSVYLECLERQLKVKILDPLKVAVAEGLVMNIKGYYTFAHDRIQDTGGVLWHDWTAGSSFEPHNIWQVLTQKKVIRVMCTPC